jgi:hypothetical protein
MAYTMLLTAALALSGRADLPREPFCIGAKSYSGMARRSVGSLPPDLERDVQNRSGVTLETWYDGGSEAVVIAVAHGHDRAFSYEKVGLAHRFVSEEEVPCLQE